MALQPTIRVASSTGVSVTNSTVETDLFTMSLPGGALVRTGWGVTVRAHGSAIASSSATLTLRLKSRVGASTTTIYTAAITLTTDSDPRQWQTEVSGMFATTAAQHYRSRFTMAAASTSLIAASTMDLVGASTQGQSGTGSVTYALTAAWDRASTQLVANGMVGTLDLSR